MTGEDTEIIRIKRYLAGMSTDIPVELQNIGRMKETTDAMHKAGYIDDTRFVTEMMTLSARYLRLLEMQQEMFGRFSGCMAN